MYPECPVLCLCPSPTSTSANLPAVELEAKERESTGRLGKNGGVANGNPDSTADDTVCKYRQ